MEWELGLAVLGVVAVTAAAVYLVSVMGIKEKSFEEAIAEQKKRSEDLLGRKESKKKVPVKDKSKKQKKAKEKEKHQVPYSGESDAVDTAHHHHEEGSKHHVEIDPEPEILDDVSVSESRRASVVRIRDSIKPILVNKEEHSPVVEQNDVEPANHFEMIHPKDDLELRRHINYDETPPSPPPPLPQRNLKKSNQKKQQQQQQQQQQQEEAGTGDAPSSEPNLSGYYENVAAVEEQIVDQLDKGEDDRQYNDRSGLRNRKNKQQQRGEQDQLTAAKLESTIEKVSLSSSEIQNLIDILLNKQHAGDSEWVNKGKNDSVGNLKKQLAERERQLTEEQVTVQTLQSKLKDLRFEFTAEKTKFSQHRRQLEDASNQKMQDLQQLQSQLQRAGVDKQQLQQKLQQMQLSLNTLRDENVAVKSALNVEQSNRGKADSLEREAEALRTQCGHLENQLKAAFQSNQDLSNQSRNLQEHLRVLEERKNLDEHNIHAQFAQQSQEREALEKKREAHFLSEIKKFQDLLAEGEKERISLRQQNSNLQNSMRNSQETAIALEEANKKLEDLREAEKNTKNLLDDSNNQVASLKSQLQANDSKVKSLEEGHKQLLEQISALNEKQLAAEKERELNGDIKSHADQEAANANKIRLAELESTLVEKEGQITELNKVNSQFKNEVEKSTEDLKSQREKNDELRVKNTKLMDTLNVTEKNLETRITQCELLVQEERIKARNEVEKSLQSALDKYFPQIKFDISNPDWIDTFSKSIEEEVIKAQPISANNDSKLSLEFKNLQEVNSRLQEEVTHYQNVLSSTETLLSNLQASIEKEEKRWLQKLQQKEAELNAVLGQSPSANVDLKAQLDGEREEKSVLLERCSELENNIQNLKKQLEQADSLQLSVEKLQEEVRQERLKGTELSTEKSRLEAEVIKQQESYKAEQARLEAELESLKKQVSLDDSLSSSIISSNGVVNGKSVDSSVSPGSEPVLKSGGNLPAPSSPQHASSSTTASPPVTPNTTNADLPISSKDSKDSKEKPDKKKKSKGASARKEK